MQNLPTLVHTIEMPDDPVAFLIDHGEMRRDENGVIWMKCAEPVFSSTDSCPAPQPRSLRAEQELVSIKILSALIGTPEKTIRDWVYRSRKNPTFDPLPYHKLGGLMRFRLKDIHAWIDRRRIRVSRATV